MKSHNIVLLFAVVTAVIVSACGCTSTANKLADGVAGKSISGSGTFGYSRVGLDKTTQTPELVSLFVWGDYTSVVPGDEIFRLEETEGASIFNSEAISKRRKVFFATGDKARMDKVIDKISKTEKTENSGN